MPTTTYDTQRARMVNDQVIARGIDDPRVVNAMRRVPRHLFVPEHLRGAAYEDGPLPIGHKQTISQPYIVALMTQMLELSPEDVVLEVGTGSGYQAAILGEIVREVHSLERHPALAATASRVLDQLGYTNIHVVVGDGSQGLPESAPFNAIIVTAAAPAIPGPLQTQLADGGRLVLPVGDSLQQFLRRVRRSGETWHMEGLIPVMFVPLVGRHGFRPSETDDTPPTR